jgi:hypothetical protein
MHPGLGNLLQIHMFPMNYPAAELRNINIVFINSVEKHRGTDPDEYRESFATAIRVSP